MSAGEIKKAIAYSSNLRSRRAIRLEHKCGWAVRNKTWAVSEECQRWSQSLLEDDNAVEGTPWDNYRASARRTKRLREHVTFQDQQQIKNGDGSPPVTRNMKTGGDTAGGSVSLNMGAPNVGAHNNPHPVAQEPLKPVSHTFKYNLLLKATNNFYKRLGIGGFGSVFQGVIV